MKTWNRAAFACGNCAAIMPAGSPRLQFWFKGKDGQFAKDRCEKCAGEPVPADLPASIGRPVQPLILTQFDEDGIERPINVKPMTHVSRGRALPFDHKQKAAGE